mgnify:FL=1
MSLGGSLAAATARFSRAGLFATAAAALAPVARLPGPIGAAAGEISVRAMQQALLFAAEGLAQIALAGSTEPTETYRSLDADARTLTEEWQQSVRERFARRSGAELRCVPSTTDTSPLP